MLRLKPFDQRTLRIKSNAGVAQRQRQTTQNRSSMGSNPMSGTTLDNRVIGHGPTVNRVLFGWVTYS